MIAISQDGETRVGTNKVRVAWGLKGYTVSVIPHESGRWVKMAMYRRPTDALRAIQEFNAAKDNWNKEFRFPKEA